MYLSGETAQQTFTCSELHSKNANVRKRWEINNATPFSSVYFVGFKPLLVLWELLGQIFSSYCWISFGKNFGIHSFSNLPTDTAYAINSFDGQWHYFDDSSVSSADADSPVVSGFHHLFFPLLFSWHQCTEMQGFYRISILNPNKRRVPWKDRVCLLICPSICL